MSFLTTAEKTTLREQIQQAESGTTGEIVTVIADQSDGYRFIPLLWAALISLSIPGLFFLYQYLATAGWHYPGDSSRGLARVYHVQVLVFLGLASVFQWAPIRLWLIPKAIKLQRAQRHAREQFFVQNLHLTQNNTGVLIFVSVAEHYVEIIVDDAVATAVDNAVWQSTIDDFIQHVRQGNIATGFEEAIDHCKNVLCEHFPAPHGRPDELPNHLIEIRHSDAGNP